MDRYEVMGYVKPALVGAAAAWLTWAALGEWRTWVAIKSFVVPIMQQQAATQQRQQAPVPAPTPSPAK